MKRKLINSLRLLLVAALLMVGANAWAVTKTLYSQNFNSESGVPTGWTQASGTLSLEESGGNKWLRETTSGSGSRTAWYTGTGIKDAISTYTSYVLEFDCLIKEGTNTTNYCQGVWVTGSNLAQSWGTPTGYAIGVKKGNNETTYTIQANAASTEETVNLTSNTWYHYVCAYDHTTKKITFSILSQDQSSTIYAAHEFDYDYSGEGKGVFQSIHFQSGRGSGYTELDNILLTTEVDEEVVSDPTIGDPVYAGANRTVTITSGESSESNAVTTYYTIDGKDPSASYNEGSFTTTSKDVTITSSCTLKAISISSIEVSSNVASRAITVGKLTLNAPTFTKTAYSAGNYSVEITSNQSNLDYVPASPVIKYSIDGGSEETYSSAIAVPEGSTVAAHVEADNYNNSSTEELETGIQPNLPVNWTQNYVGKVTGDITLYEDGEGYHNCIVSEAGGDYCVYSSDGTSAFTNANAGFQVYYHKSSPRKWMIRQSTGGGGMYNFTAGNAGVAIANLTTGQIVKVEWTNSSYGGFWSNSGVTQLNDISYGSVGYYEVTADGTAYFTAARGVYVKNITVYNPTVSGTITPCGWTTFASPYALNLSSMTASKGTVEAYYASNATGSTVTLTSTNSSAVAAGEGLMLKGTAGATITIPVVASGSAIAGNLLKGQTTTGNVAASTSGKYHYVFGYSKTDATEYGFYNLTAATEVAAGKAYLETDTELSTAAARLTIVFDDETTGIGSVNSEENKAKEIYNLQGQRVDTLKKGLYIVNGKKVMVK